MKRVVAHQRLGFVATVCTDGTPNLSPKGTLRVLDDEHLMFADIRSPGTIANLRIDPSIEINVVDPLVRKGFRFKGRGEIVESGADFERLLESFVVPGPSDAPRRIRAIVVVRVEQVRPLISPGYDSGTNESAMRARWTEHYFGNGVRTGMTTVDDDLATLDREALIEEVKRLRAAIREHRDTSEHELCWHHPKLWGLLPEKSDPQPVVPEWPQFLRGCIRYRESLDRQLPGVPRTRKEFDGRE